MRMRKPLITDEMIGRSKRHQSSQEFGYYAPEGEEEYWYDEEYEDDFYEDDWDDTQEYDVYDDEYDDWDEEWEEDYTGYHEGQTVRIPVDASIVKSRRIETIKKDEFRTKVNKILFWVILLVILFILAVIYL